MVLTHFWKVSALAGMTLFFSVVIVNLLLVTGPNAIENDEKMIEVDTNNGEKEEPVVNNYFVFLYSRGPGWVDGKPVPEQPFLNGHFEYMSRLEKQGILVIGGPFKDESGVMGILKAVSLVDAQQLIDHDPVIQNKILKAVVREWYPSVTGCIEPRD